MAASRYTGPAMGLANMRSLGVGAHADAALAAAGFFAGLAAGAGEMPPTSDRRGPQAPTDEQIDGRNVA